MERLRKDGAALVYRCAKQRSEPAHRIYHAQCRHPTSDIRQILDHIGVDSEPPHISQARGPPLWDGCDAQVGEGADGEPDWDLAAQPAPDYEVDQRINW